MADGVNLGNTEAKITSTNGVSNVVKSSADDALQSAVKTAYPESSTANKIANYGSESNYMNISTGRAVPKTLSEQLVLEEAKAGAGTNTGIILDDSRFKGWNKMQHVHSSPTKNITTFSNPSGSKNITVHYNQNPTTGQTADFKFTNP